MNIIDFSIIAVLTVSCIISLLRGFVKEVVSLASWILAFTLSTSYAEKGQHVFAGSISNPTVQFGLSLILIFILVLLLGAIINKLVGLVISKVGLGPFDKIIGLFFGFTRGVLLVCTVVFFAMMSNIENSLVWKRSVLLPNFISVIDWLDVDPIDLPGFDANQYRLSSNQLGAIEDQLSQ
jgi:membrane protein required for colicin V production